MDRYIALHWDDCYGFQLEIYMDLSYNKLNYNK